MPIDLSDITLHLDAVVSGANEWCRKAYEIVGIRNGIPGTLNIHDWIVTIRKHLDDKATGDTVFAAFTKLTEAASDLPFLVDEEAVLSAELSSRKWTDEVTAAMSLKHLLLPGQLQHYLSSASHILDNLHSCLKNVPEWKIEKMDMVRCLNCWRLVIH